MFVSIEEQQHRDAIKSKIGYKEFVFMLASLMAINALAIDVMLPALDQICLSMNVEAGNQQHYIIFMYLIGFGVAQLFYGPISDSFGRKKPMLLSLFAFAITAIASIFVHNFYLFLIMRFIQGATAAATRVITISIIRDLYHGDAMATTLSMVLVVFIMVPVLAPATGQLLLFFGEWHIIFIFMAVLALAISIWVNLRLPETIFHKREFNISNILNGFKIVFSNRIVVFYSLAVSFIFSAILTLINTAKQIYVEVYHLGKLFPLAFASVAIAQSIAAFMNNKYVPKFGILRITHGLLLLHIIFTSILFIFSWYGNCTVAFPVYITLLMCTMFCYGAMGANLNSLAMEPLGKIAGTAAAVIGFSQTIISSTLALYIGQQYNGTVEPITKGFVVLGIISLIFVLIAERFSLFRR